MPAVATGARTTPGRPAKPRLTAQQRREQVVRAAQTEFAHTGLHGTSTEAIARRAGISHAYLFRLFPTKKELFIACAGRCMERTRETFRAAAAEAERPDPDAVLGAMGQAYVGMLADREILLSQMQMYAACDDPEIRAVAREGFGELFEEVERLSGADPERVQAFFARGMLLNVVAAMDLPELADSEAWVRRALRPAS